MFNLLKAFCCQFCHTMKWFHWIFNRNSRWNQKVNIVSSPNYHSSDVIYPFGWKQSLKKEMKRISTNESDSNSLSKHCDGEWARMRWCTQCTGWKSFRFMNNFVSFRMKYLSRTRICFYFHWCRTKFQLEFPFPFLHHKQKKQRWTIYFFCPFKAQHRVLQLLRLWILNHHRL